MRPERKTNHSRFFFICALLVVIGLSPSKSFADMGEFTLPEFFFTDETLNPGVEFKQNPFKYEAPPKPFKGFLLFADMSVSQSYNSNIRAENNNPDADFITTVKPHFKVLKELSRHTFFIETQAEIRRAFENRNENTEDYEVLLSANLEAFRGLNLVLNAGVNSLHRTRNAVITDRKTITPTEYDTSFARGGIRYIPNRLRVDAHLEHISRNFENNTVIEGNTPLVLDDADIDVTSAVLELAYRIRPNWEPFLRLTRNKNEYQRPIYQNGSYSGIKRDNNYTQYLAGTIFNYKGIVYGDAALGFDTIDYNSAGIDSVSNVSYESDLFWEPTPKSKFNLFLSQRSVEDNEIVSGYDATHIDLEHHYELQRDLYLRALAGYYGRDFTSEDRTDKDYTAGLGIKYFINQRFQIGAEYLYSERQSTEPDIEFDQNVMTVRLTGAL